VIVSKQQIILVKKNSKYSKDYLHWSIGYIDLSYQFNTPEYHKSDLEEHLLKTYAEGGRFESKSKTGFLIKFKKSIVSAHGKITYKFAELFSKDRICEEWCEHERIKRIGRHSAEIIAVITGFALVLTSGEHNFVEKASPFAAALFLKINKKLDKYCNCREKTTEKIEQGKIKLKNEIEKEKAITLQKLERLRKTLAGKDNETVEAIDGLTKRLKKKKVKN